MVSSLDCTHWAWEKCSNVWKRKFTRGDIGELSFIWEAVAFQDLWIWHTFFGVAGLNNDLNVLWQSSIFNDIWTGEAPDMSFEVNDHSYFHGYYICDEIYLDYATFVKAYTHSCDEKTKLFTQRKESTRKDIEMEFGVLK